MLRRTLAYFCLVCCALSLSPSPAHASGDLALSVDEGATRAVLTLGVCRITMALANRSGAPRAARLSVELVDARDVVIAEAVRAILAPTGVSSTEVAVAVPASRGGWDDDALPVYRVRYRIEPDGGPPTTGVVALSMLVRELFDLTAIVPQRAVVGAPYRATVLATNPVSGAPVPGVVVEAKLHLDGDTDADYVETVRTDARGTARLAFDVPAGRGIYDGNFKARGRLAGFEDTVDTSLYFQDDEVRVLVATDKGIYQPGQPLHMRCLAFDEPHGAGRRALAGADVTFRVRDERDSTEFTTETTTSRFGVASADWTIPEGAKLGTYTLEAEVGDDDGLSGSGMTGIAVSRYDLPAFAVSATLDRPYYLDGQNADVEVSADYLFGRPVPNGRVRVVREQEREWNFDKQKWEITEGSAVEGDAGPDGRFTAHVDLTAEHDSLAGDDYLRFRDVTYTAYVTDPATNRTEERRFDVRVTRDAIHVYTIGLDAVSPGRPSDFYVAASYADGAPAQCDVRVVEDGRALASVRTNRYGVARIRGIAVHGDDTSDAAVEFDARDSQGRAGVHVERFPLDSSAIRVATDRPIYRPGDPIRATVDASDRDGTVVAELVVNGEALDSRTMRLHDGRASTTFAYREAFEGADVRVTAFELQQFTEQRYQYGHARYWYDGPTTGVRRVLYPSDSELKVLVRGKRDEYRPGDTVRAELRVRDADGRGVEGALGVVVVDKAVAERERTNRFLLHGSGLFEGYGELVDDASVGGVTRSDLERLDPTRPIPADLALAAEVLLIPMSSAEHTILSNVERTSLRQTFSPLFDPIHAFITRSLAADANREQRSPENIKDLRAALVRCGLDPDAALRDPWGSELAASFSINRTVRTVQLTSVGPDKRMGTPDDFEVESFSWPYFAASGLIIDRAITAYHARTGGFVRDAATFARALADAGAPAGVLDDAWGRPCRAEVSVDGHFYVTSIVSSGPDGRPGSATAFPDDDVRLWTTSVDYFADDSARIAAILANATLTPAALRTEADLGDALRKAGLDLATVVDAWGHPYHPAFEITVRSDGRVSTVDRSAYGAATHQRDTRIAEGAFDDVRFVSDGPDGVAGTSDDFVAGVVSRRHSDPTDATTSNLAGAGATGAISGTVVDSMGAVVAGATVKARNDATGYEVSVTTNGDGTYLLRNIPPGLYEVSVTTPGFVKRVVSSVPVRSSVLTTLAIELSIGSVAESVDVVAGAQNVQVNTESQTLDTVVREGRQPKTALRMNAAASTPRVRQYFPETLYWQPSLETDRSGRATITFPLADSITTWKLSVFASTADGRVGRVETDLLAFQPFFVEHDPPRVLTEGDRISLPVLVRNYMDSAEDVDVGIRPEPWLAVDGPARRSIRVPAGEAGRAVFDVRPTASITDGAQRVDALGKAASDAVEKPVSVHPDGEPREIATAQILTNAAVFDVEVPESAVGVTGAKVKIYPDLTAHLVESVEAILERPHGCGEQTISSTYPSVMLLEAGADRLDAATRKRATTYAAAGVERLRRYQSPDGGFTYWGEGASDVALTTYALEFLRDARALGFADDEILARTAAFLLRSQRTDGSWSGDLLDTAYVTRLLAGIARADGAERSRETAEAVRRALAYLHDPARSSANSYVLACYALAALDAGADADAQWAVDRLAELARRDGDACAWSIDGHTPFNGWGRAGGIETTSLVVLAFERAHAHEDLVGCGLLYILRNEDVYGVWYSTQATVSALHAMIGSASRQDVAAGGTVEVLVNGVRVDVAELPHGPAIGGPVTIELPGPLARGANHIELRRSDGTGPASAQLSARWYAAWPTEAASRGGRADRTDGPLRLAVAYDRTEVAAGDPVTCTVETGRTTGWGMLVGEIGLPPGAEVDRESLERVIADGRSGLYGYDVLPDRVVLYLWPRYYGVRGDVRFVFRPRYGMSALAAPSVLFDYYNPDARVTLAPPRFDVKDESWARPDQR